MSLKIELSSDFPSTIRSRGESYYQSGLVTIRSGSAREVTATVRGSEKYQVLLLREDNAITGRCSCPYFDSSGPCKHLWATILEADELGFLKDGSGPASFIYESADDDEYEDYEDDDDDNEDEEEYTSPRYIAERVISPEIRERLRQAAHARQARVQGRLAEPKPPTVQSQLESKPRMVKSWREQLQQMGLKGHTATPTQSKAWPPERQLLYVIDVPQTMSSQRLTLDILTRDRRADEGWSVAQKRGVPYRMIADLPDPADRQILASLGGAREQYDYNSYYNPFSYDAPSRYSLFAPLPQLLLPAIARTGRCGLRLVTNSPDWFLVEWDEGEAWQFRIEIEPMKNQYQIKGVLHRGEERMELSKPVLLLEGGLVFTTERVALLDDSSAFEWLSGMRRGGAFKLPQKQISEFLTDLLSELKPPPLNLPEELRYEEVAQTPRPCLTIKSPKHGNWSYNNRLSGKLYFDYTPGQPGGEINFEDARRGVYIAEQQRFILRDKAAEAGAAVLLAEFGFRYSSPTYQEKESTWELAPKKLPRIARELVNLGWHVEADNKVFRTPGDIDIRVSSGIDWFELHGTVEFGDTRARLPELLAALRRGENMVKLDDGSFGMLPEDWLKKYGLIANLGETHDDHLRFKRNQVGVLDALLAAQPEAKFDATFANARDQLKHFRGVESAEPPAGFIGELRPYQKDGLGWMHFLRQFDFGGCLADDMGVGKTVQVLALLEARRELRDGATGRQEKATKGKAKTGKSKSLNPPVPPSPSPPVSPSLVVVPKSLIFNWKQEAARFAPKLRLLDHTGAFRQKGVDHFEDYDLVMTTYGTLRRDVVDFKDIEFDYVILDEAQAIKNANTESAKASRLLNGKYRLALSGTPVENHLGELWSLFEFLNPGMLGAASVFKMAGAAARNPDDETRKMLSQALRPFILRRTKDQVAKDLPAKLEQTLFCEFEPKQRRLYNELRDHYRASLLNRVARDGIAKSKMHVLEALLRLRQAACHPGLIDKKRTGEPSAKLDMLLPQLASVIEEGHKVLLFSQFTSLLAIVRQRLDKEGITYEYLDGKTRNRQACVERFQTDPDCKLFLISLKAGGLGLNLTAAEYVYLLDPWWNPAVEAQAIDRAHRIGQANQVFAYRLIAKDTVEEKVLQLQNTKRDLADAIINADNSLIRSLKKEDLEMLLS
ncbi:MAG: DEAD/DEAH box helicase [Acidobacteriota bacterium]|nr:DEAD/DEAH box helicase [Acidobacteriota bacterium]